MYGVHVWKRWLLFECSDCAPSVISDDEHEYDKPFQLALPVDAEYTFSDDVNSEVKYDLSNLQTACPISHCPRCDSYLSMGAVDYVELKEEVA